MDEFEAGIRQGFYIVAAPVVIRRAASCCILSESTAIKPPLTPDPNQQ
jgi:hypothetical protein